MRPSLVCSIVFGISIAPIAPSLAASAPQVIRVGKDSAAGGTLSVAARNSLLRHQGFTVLEPTAAPAFALRNVDGSTKRLGDYRGRWVLLNFFATWCGPCDSEMPSLQILSTRVRDTTTVVAIATDSDDDVGQYGRERGLSFPLLLDADGSVRSAYGVHGYPTTFLIDPASKVIAMARGARDWRSAGALLIRLKP